MSVMEWSEGPSYEQIQALQQEVASLRAAKEAAEAKLAIAEALNETNQHLGACLETAEAKCARLEAELSFAGNLAKGAVAGMEAALAECQSDLKALSEHATAAVNECERRGRRLAALASQERQTCGTCRHAQPYVHDVDTPVCGNGESPAYRRHVSSDFGCVLFAPPPAPSGDAQ